MNRTIWQGALWSLLAARAAVTVAIVLAYGPPHTMKRWILIAVPLVLGLELALFARRPRSSRCAQILDGLLVGLTGMALLAIDLLVLDLLWEQRVTLAARALAVMLDIAMVVAFALVRRASRSGKAAP